MQLKYQDHLVPNLTKSTYGATRDTKCRSIHKVVEAGIDSEGIKASREILEELFNEEWLGREQERHSLSIGYISKVKLKLKTTFKNIYRYHHDNL